MCLRANVRVLGVALLMLLGGFAEYFVVLAAEPIVLVRNGKPAATIVISDFPLPIPAADTEQTVEYAAIELQNFIKQATGATLPIVHAADAPRAGTLILLGRSDLTEKFGLSIPTAPEGVRIVAFSRGIAILGEVGVNPINPGLGEMDRGTLHGVYEFLERVVGYRFYFHYPQDPELGIVIPRQDTITVPADYYWEGAPDFQYRFGSAFVFWGPEGNSLGWLRVNRTGNTTGFDANHTDTEWGVVYSKSRPGVLAVTADGTRSNTQLCYSSAETLEQRLENIKNYDGQGLGRYLFAHVPPNPKYVAFVPSDNHRYNFCLCELCRAGFREDKGHWGTFSDIIFTHGSLLAEELNRRNPGRRVAMLAYNNYTAPPDREIPENLDVMLCWTSLLNNQDSWREGYLQWLKEWSVKVGGKRERLFTWDYPCWPTLWVKAPIIIPHVEQKWLQEIYPIVSGQFLNPGGMTLQLGHFMNLVWHRLLWDRNTDVDALLHDYCMQFFGPAGPSMEAMYRLMIERYETVQWPRRLPAPYVPPEYIYGLTYTPEVIRTLREYFNMAWEACLDDDENELYRRRLAWMQIELESFFTEADNMHRWINHPPLYIVNPVMEVPKTEAEWERMLTTHLVQDRADGALATPATRIAILRYGDSIHVGFMADEPTWLEEEDQLSFELFPGVQADLPPVLTDNYLDFQNKDAVRAKLYENIENKLFFTVTGKGAVNGNLGATVVKSSLKDGVWFVHVVFSVKKLSLGVLDETSFAAQIRRVRAPRVGETEVSKYCWMPQILPEWPEHKLYFGKIHIRKANP